VADRNEFERAANILGTVYRGLYTLGKVPLDIGALPTERGLSAVILRALSFVYGDAGTPIQKAYRNAYNTIIPKLQEAAQAWADKTLLSQKDMLDQLATRLQTPGIEERLHEAAQRVGRRAAGFERTKDDVNEGVARRGMPTSNWTASDYYELDQEIEGLVRQRVATAVREELAAATHNDPALDVREMLAADVRKEQGELLAILFSHPKGVTILSAYSQSPIKGTEVAVELVREAARATGEFRDELLENSEWVWRYPVLVVAGVTQLGLHDVDGFPEYAVAIGQVLGHRDLSSVAASVSFHLGLALLCVGLLVFPPAGAAAIIVNVLDLALAGTGVALTYLREREQELAAEASEFLPKEERFATSNQYGDTALAAAMTLVGAIFFLRQVSQYRQLLHLQARDIHAIPPPKKITPAKPSPVDSTSTSNPALTDRLGASGAQQRVALVDPIGTSKPSLGASGLETAPPTSGTRTTTEFPRGPQEAAGARIPESKATTRLQDPEEVRLTKNRATDAPATPGGPRSPAPSGGIRRPSPDDPDVFRTSSELPGGRIPFSPPDSRALNSGSHIHLVDEAGRPVMAEGWLHPVQGTRSPGAQRAVSGPYPSYQATHLIGREFNGSGNAYNLVPLAPHINKSQIRILEISLNQSVQSGRDTYLQVYVRYGDLGSIPESITYRRFELRQGRLDLIDQVTFGREFPEYIQ
jgi:hypothetical protein